MKLPNGYGSICKLSGNRRKPFMVREGKSGKQKPIAYAETREEALQILAAYNASTELEIKEHMTFQELWEEFLLYRGKKLSVSTINSLKSVLRYCSSVVDYDYCQIKAFHMQRCIDDCGHGYATQNAIKNLFYHLDRFAIELDLCSTNFSSILTTEPTPDTTKEVFSDEERKKLWDNVTLPWVDSVLIFLYTGLRISELLEIRKENVDVVAWTITGVKRPQQAKTEPYRFTAKYVP